MFKYVLNFFSVREKSIMKGSHFNSDYNTNTLVRTWNNSPDQFHTSFELFEKLHAFSNISHIQN